MTVIGVPELLARFARTEVAAEVAQRAAIDEMGLEVALTAQSLAPVDTGELRDSISYADGAVTATADYAPYVEYGTAADAAQPFMRPAADTVNAEPALATAAKIIEGA